MSRINPGDVEREAKHHAELYHVLRNRIGFEDEPKSWEYDGYSFDIVSFEQGTESGFADIVVYDGQDPWLVIECKKLVKNKAVEDFDPHSSAVIGQASRYANDLGASYIATYNGETLVLLRAHEEHTSLNQRRRVAYSSSEYEDREDIIFSALGDMVEIQEGSDKWAGDLDTLVERLRKLHRFIYPGLQDTLEDRLESDDEYLEKFAEWQKDQGRTYKTSWINSNSAKTKRKRDAVHEDFAKQDAYLWINQLIFYKILEDTPRFRVYSNREFYDRSDEDDKILAIDQLSVDELDFLQDYLRTRFDRIVEDVDYEAVFSQDEIFGEVEINERTADTLNDFIDELDGYNLSDIGRDFLGDIYEKLIPIEERRQLGEFYTPHEVAEFIVNAVLDNPKQSVLDPACGTGTFLTAAYQWKNRHDNLDHQTIVDQLAGVDVNRFAAHLAVINLARQNLNAKTERTNILINDFFDLEGGQQHPITAGTAELDNNNSATDQEKQDELIEVAKRISGVDAVVANPPYISWTQIDPDRRNRIRKHLPHKYREGNQKISGKSDIYQYFFTACLEGLDDGKKLGFLTSYKWTTIQGGVNLMKYFLNNTRIIGIIGFNKSLFGDALVNTYVTILEKREEDNDQNKSVRDDNYVSFVRVEEEIDPDRLLKVVESDVTDQTEGYRVIQRLQKNLHEEEKWSRYIVAPRQYFEVLQHPKVTDITDVCDFPQATGTKTQADDFFEIDENDLEEWDIPEEYLTPGLFSSRQIDHEQFLFSTSDSNKFFLDLHDVTNKIIKKVEQAASYGGNAVQPQQEEEIIEERLKDYLREGGHGDVADYIEQGREDLEDLIENDPNENIYNRGLTWWDIGELAGPRLVMIETRQYRPGVLWNRDQLPVKDTGRPFHTKTEEKRDEEVVAGILNSSLGRILIESHGRISGGSAIRMLVYDIESLPMIDLREMKKETKTRIRDAFREWIESDDHTQFDEKLDRAVLSALEDTDEESDEDTWESRWEEFQDKAERMMDIRNESGEVELLLSSEEQEQNIEDIVSEGARVNETLGDF